MTSKWIEELEASFYLVKANEDPWNVWKAMNSTVERIDKLLRKAMQHVDNEELHDLIRDEITGKPMMTRDNFGEFEDDKTEEN